MIRAYAIPPDVQVPEEVEWEVGPERMLCASPRVDAAWIEALARRLIAEAPQLRERPTSEIVAVLDRVAARWLDRDDPLRREAEELLPRTTGYAPATIREALNTLFTGLRREPLETLIRAELGGADALDGWVERPIRMRAVGPRLTVVWASGNVPVAAPPAMLHALLVKSPCLVKTAAAEPVLAALLARSLVEEAPWLEGALAVVHWPGTDSEVGRAVLREAEAIVAFGDEGTLANVRSWAKAGARFRAHGHRVSFGIISREALREEAIDDLAARIARDVVLFDQQGCMSPHLYYVEEVPSTTGQQTTNDQRPTTNDRQPTTRALAERVAARLAEEEARAPRRVLSPQEATAIHQLRVAYEMRAIAGEAVALLASPGGTAWTVILDPDPTFTLSCLNRTVFLKPIADLADVPGWMAPMREHLQTVVLDVPASRRPALELALARLGVTRIARLGHAQEPRLIAPHDGSPHLADLVRWTTVEG